MKYPMYKRGRGVYTFWKHRLCVAKYYLESNELVVVKDDSEVGVLKPVDLPYHWIINYTHNNAAMRVKKNMPELGFLVASLLPSCYMCIYDTNNYLLPCTVNPCSHGEVCRDYEVKSEYKQD